MTNCRNPLLRSQLDREVTVNTEEIELDLDDVWEEIDLYVRLCGGDPRMVTTDHNRIATRRNIEDEIESAYHAYGAELFGDPLAEIERLKEQLASLLQALKCKTAADTALVAEMDRAKELLA
jgi:hypothetical protein